RGQLVADFGVMERRDPKTHQGRTVPAANDRRRRAETLGLIGLSEGDRALPEIATRVAERLAQGGDPEASHKASTELGVSRLTRPIRVASSAAQASPLQSRFEADANGLFQVSNKTKERTGLTDADVAAKAARFARDSKGRERFKELMALAKSWGIKLGQHERTTILDTAHGRTHLIHKVRALKEAIPDSTQGLDKTTGEAIGARAMRRRIIEAVIAGASEDIAGLLASIGATAPAEADLETSAPEAFERLLVLKGKRRPESLLGNSEAQALFEIISKELGVRLTKNAKIKMLMGDRFGFEPDLLRGLIASDTRFEQTTVKGSKTTHEKIFVAPSPNDPALRDYAVVNDAGELVTVAR